jgi:hypothetical protein
LSAQPPLLQTWESLFHFLSLKDNLIDMRVVLLLFLGFFLTHPFSLSAQTEWLAGQQIGVYISSKGFSFSEEHQIPISQFLKVENEEAWQGRLRSELLIQIGWLFCEQLQALGKADSVHFLNADLKWGKAMQESYQVNNLKLNGKNPDLAGFDHIVVINPFGLHTRIHKSVFIRSNRMISERVPVSVGQMTIGILDPNRLGEEQYYDVCFDQQTSEKPAESFDFHRSESAFGKFLSHCFSQWWAQVLSNTSSSCAEE